MMQFAVYCARMALCGLVALAATACVRIGPPQGWLARQEPRSTQPPIPGEHAPIISEQDRVDALERQVADIHADLAHMRKALEVMGPLPPTDAFFIPVDAKAAVHPVAEPLVQMPPKSRITMDDVGAGIPAGDIYASPPQLAKGQSLFYEAELATYPSLPEAEAGWKKLASEVRLTGLEPRYDSTNSTVRLSVGPFTSKTAVDALCVELAALAGPCRPTAPVRAVR